ncbi:MAG: ribonuclease D [Gemmataceae bacterium]|nr:ribonuclease D [Gemmataceae bacterium]
MPDIAEIVVDQADLLQQCCDRLSQCERFGFDTEFVGEHTYHPELCLVQIAAPDALYLVDPFAFENLDPFWRLVADPLRQVIVHAGREEVRLCHNAFGQAPGRIFDLQIAAGMAGFPFPMGHGALVQTLLGKKLKKSETLTEWRTRPLTPGQIKYAFDDVRYLLAMQIKIAAKLKELNRSDWAEEEFQRLTQDSSPREPSTETVGERWRKIRGSGNLDRRRLAVLRELYLWREQKAIELDRPARVIVRDDLLVEIARRHLKSPKDLEVVRGLTKKHLDEIFQAGERGQKLPFDQCPEATERDVEAPRVGLIVNLTNAVLADWSIRNQLAPNLVASNSDIRNLVRAFLDGDHKTADTLLLQGWRGEHALPVLLEVLEGKTSVRIADPSADAPFGYSA